MPPQKISNLNLRGSKSLVRFMISPSKRKSILRMLSLDNSIRNSINPRNTTLLLSISPRITNMYRKVITDPQHRKIQGEVAMDQEVDTATIMRVHTIRLIINKMRGDYTSPDKIAHLDRMTVIKPMANLTLKRIREPQLRMHSMKMKFITRVLPAALLVLMIENQGEALEVVNPTMMMVVIRASKAGVDAPTKRMMKIIARAENPRKIIAIHGDNLKKIPKKKQRVRVSKLRRHRTRRNTTMTTRRKETMATRNLTGREKVEISTKNQGNPKKRKMSRDSLLRSSRLNKKQRRGTWQRLRRENMIRQLRKRVTFSKLRDLTRSSSKSTTK